MFGLNVNYQKIKLPEVVGRGYKTFWNFRGRYRVIKGSRASKKSKTTALWFIWGIMKWKDANLLVIRKSYRSLKDSCYTELKWAINKLGVDDWFYCKENPLEITYKPTGQKIYFRGLDDPMKVTSITVETGTLCWMWIEEAYEIMNEDDFNMLDESIRGNVSGDLFKQITFTFNPWNERHWMKHRFFDEIIGYDKENNPIYKERSTPISEDGNILAITTNYMCNEWLDKGDKQLFEAMKKNNPRRYAVAGLGGWGIVDGLIYENWREESFELITKKEFNELSKLERESRKYVIRDNVKTVSGLDFGYTNDPSAFFIGFLDIENKKLYVWDEFYEKGLSNRKIFEKITSMGYSKERITGDSAEPKSIDELSSLGLHIKGAKKGKDSIKNGIQWIQDLEVIVHPRCNNFLTEISNYTWSKDKFGKALNVPIDDFNHLMDAMRYGLEDYIIGNRWLY